MGLSEAGDGGSTKQGNHALVLGGSLAGLLAARVLAEHFERVTVVERDALPSDTSVRKGVPQASHVHALMRRGQQVLESLFPGLIGEMLEGVNVPLLLTLNTVNPAPAPLVLLAT